MLKVNQILVAIFVFALVTAPRADAEMRVWTDKKGNKIEAEFVGRFGGKVMLRDKKGRVRKIDPAGLSEADQLILNPPPAATPMSEQYKMDLRKRSWYSKGERPVFGSNVTGEAVWEFSMSVEKKEKGALKLEGARGFVFIAGEQIESGEPTGQFIVLDTFEVPLKWESADAAVAKKGRVVTTRVRDKEGKMLTDIKYRDYAIMLISKEGEVLLFDGSRNYLEGVEKLRALKIGDLFNKKLEKVGETKVIVENEHE